MLTTVVIIGRRNVGKSALFNRLIEKNKAIISAVEGTTRDRTEGICTWRGIKLRIIDTGGLDIGDIEIIDREIKKQARFAMHEADLILFLVDARVGPTPADRTMSKELRQLSSLRDEHSILLVANKAETAKLREAAQEPSWKRLGFGIPHPISALTGQGVGDLLDEIFTKLKLDGGSDQVTTKSDLVTRSPESSEESRGSRSGIPSTSSGQALHRVAPQDDIHCRISIIGKPNVGKSSLLNKILGQERVIVSPVAHTTREPQDTLFQLTVHSQQFTVLLVDTAGIRRKAKIKPGIEQAGIAKTLQAIEKSDIVILMLDSTEMLDAQDKHLAGMIEEKGVGVIVAVNKWDLLHGARNKEHGTIPDLKACPEPAEGIKGGGENYEKSKQHTLLLKRIHFGLPGLTFAPMVFISALIGHNVQKLLPLALKINENRRRIIADEELKTLLPKLIKHHKPPRARGNTKDPIIRAIIQSAAEPPTFTVIIGPKQSLHASYLRFIQNQLRNYFDFEGTPIKIWVKQERN